MYMSDCGLGRSTRSSIRSNHIQHPSRQPRLLSQRSQRQRRVRRLSSRLDHDSTSCRNRPRDFPRDHRRREVPGRQYPNYTHGLLDSDHLVAQCCALSRISIRAGCFAGEPVDEGGGVLDLLFGAGDWAAIFEHQNAGKGLDVFWTRVCQRRRRRARSWGRVWRKDLKEWWAVSMALRAPCSSLLEWVSGSFSWGF